MGKAGKTELGLTPRKYEKTQISKAMPPSNRPSKALTLWGGEESQYVVGRARGREGSERTPVKVPPEREMQLQHSPIEAAPEPTLVRVLPGAVDDREGEVFVRRSGGEEDLTDVGVFFVLDDAVFCEKGRLGSVGEGGNWKEGDDVRGAFVLSSKSG
jgi:hypothetical protein